MQVATTPTSLNVDFGDDLSASQTLADFSALALKAPLLAGPCRQLLLKGGDTRQHGSFLVSETPSRLAGVAAIPVHGSLEGPSFRLYRELLEIIGTRQIHRAWNYVPHINDHEGELENYRAFNIGRHQAFEQAFGDRCTRCMSPASAVGIRDERLALAFIAGKDLIENIENPEQTPAYRYPSEHGPKSPSFTRGGHGIIDGTPYGFLSGTSSIKDHRSIGTDIASQFATTVDNMRIVVDRMGYTGALGDGAGMRRDFTFYLRRTDDLGAARELFRGVVGDKGIAQTRFLCADICRAELLLEIEGMFWRP